MRAFLILIILGLLFACGKDSIQIPGSSYCPVVEEGGKNIPPYKGPGWGFKSFATDSISFYNPHSNPNNKDEFVFWLESSTYQGIHTYNIKTKVRTLVLARNGNKGIPQSPIRWGRNGWIIFGDMDKNIYKIKPNGDSLTQLTQTGREFTPEWNYDGTLFCTKYWSRTGQYYTLFRDANGNIIDSIQYNNTRIFEGQPDWQHPDYLIGTNNLKVILYNYKNRSVIEIPATDLSKGFPQWISKDEFIYNGYRSIGIMNINTKQIRTIRNTKDERNYWTVNKLDNGKMLCAATVSYLHDSIQQVIGTRKGIFIINECDSNTVELNLR
jgi:hypothetical protein